MINKVDKGIFMSTNIYYVYALIDPITNIPFYIGKGKNNRCYSHLAESEDTTDNIYKFRKIRSIWSAGYEVIVQKLHTDLDQDTAYSIEEELIKKYGRKIERSDGILTNICASNRPPDLTGIPKSEEAKRNMSLAQKGRKLSPEHILKIKEANKNRIYKPHTPESIEKMRLVKQGKIFTKEHKENLSKSHKGKGIGEDNNFFGKHHTEETKQKMSEALTGKIRTDEFKQNLSNLYKGKPKGPMSEETKRKISETKRRNKMQ